MQDDTDFGAVVERDMPLTQKYLDKVKTYSKEHYSTLTDVDWKFNEKGYEFMNMGLITFSKNISKYLKGETSGQFLRRKEFKRFVDGLGYWKWSTDQTLLNYWIRKENMNLKRLDWRWNTLYKGVEDKHLTDSYFIHFFLKDHLPDKGENISTVLERSGLK